jgi:uncharacterized membrane protein
VLAGAALAALGCPLLPPLLLVPVPAALESAVPFFAPFAGRRFRLRLIARAARAAGRAPPHHPDELLDVGIVALHAPDERDAPSARHP